MPIYSYRCNECGHEFEQRQRMSDDPLTDCPVCEGGVRRVVNSVGIVFKGNGFFVTDNRNGSANGKASSISSPNGQENESSADGDQSSTPSKKKEKETAESSK